MDAEAREAGHLSWEAETDQPQPLNDQHQPRSDQQQPLTNQPAVQQPQEQLTAPDYPSSLENLPEDGSSSRSRALLPLDYYQVDEPSIGPITAVNAADNQASLVPGLAAENARQLFGGQLPAGSQVPPYYFFLNPAFRESALQGRPVFALDGGPTTYGDVFTIPAARPTYAADYNQPAFKQNGGQQMNRQQLMEQEEEDDENRMSSSSPGINNFMEDTDSADYSASAASDVHNLMEVYEDGKGGGANISNLDEADESRRYRAKRGIFGGFGGRYGGYRGHHHHHHHGHHGHRFGFHHFG